MTVPGRARTALGDGRMALERVCLGLTYRQRLRRDGTMRR